MVLIGRVIQRDRQVQQSSAFRVFGLTQSRLQMDLQFVVAPMLARRAAMRRRSWIGFFLELVRVVWLAFSTFGIVTIVSTLQGFCKTIVLHGHITQPLYAQYKAQLPAEFRLSLA